MSLLLSLFRTFASEGKSRFRARSSSERENNYTYQHSEWASPVVVVPKPKSDIRICVDFGITINPYLKTVHYPLPNIEEIFFQTVIISVFSI